MAKPKQYAPFFTRSDCDKLATSCLACDDLQSAASVLRKEANRLMRKAKRRNQKTKSGDKLVGQVWAESFDKLADGFEQNRAAFKVFAKGNSKLPFYSYSELPGHTCPGAGECLRFCYSYVAWRYPAAFCRQLQNTLLMRFKRGIITREFAKIKPRKDGAPVVVRLYVDGDFSDVSTFAFWQGQLTRAPHVAAYGYSKSWNVIKDYKEGTAPFAPNYVLNMSSGSRYDSDDNLKSLIASYDITRGEFLAVRAEGKFAKGFKRFDDSAYHEAVRHAGRAITGQQRVFSCTGKCGECLPNGAHACGVATFTVPIVIAEHN